VSDHVRRWAGTIASKRMNNFSTALPGQEAQYCSELATLVLLYKEQTTARLCI
jgi:hypothetical protein